MGNRWLLIAGSCFFFGCGSCTIRDYWTPFGVLRMELARYPRQVCRGLIKGYPCRGSVLRWFHFKSHNISAGEGFCGTCLWRNRNFCAGWIEDVPFFSGNLRDFHLIHMENLLWIYTWLWLRKPRTGV